MDGTQLIRVVIGVGAAKLQRWSAACTLFNWRAHTGSAGRARSGYAIGRSECVQQQQSPFVAAAAGENGVLQLGRMELFVMCGNYTAWWHVFIGMWSCTRDHCFVYSQWNALLNFLLVQPFTYLHLTACLLCEFNRVSIAFMCALLHVLSWSNMC